MSRLSLTVGPSKRGIGTENSLPPLLSSLSITNKLHSDPDTLNAASTDFGNIIRENPLAVLRPSSIEDIITIVKFGYDNKGSSPLANFTVTARGHGHSIRGQAMARDGIVIEMSALNKQGKDHGRGKAAAISWQQPLRFYADVGGEQLWIDVLQETLKHGLTPVSWTDYLYLTVGGTLSNAGISGLTFRYGPQISNVHEMDVVTGMNTLFAFFSFCFFCFLGAYVERKGNRIVVAGLTFKLSHRKNPSIWKQNPAR